MALPTPVSPSSETYQQPMRNENWMLNDEMDEQIRSTHVPDGPVVDVKPILQVTGEVLLHTMNGGSGHIDVFDDQTILSAVDGTLDAVDKICSELSSNCSGGGNDHATTMAIFNMLSSYSWGAKVVLTLAAFAVKFGEFWLISQLFTSNSLAKSMALLKRPAILGNSQTLKPYFDALRKRINAMINVTECIVELTELPSKYIPIDEPPLSTTMADIRSATFCIISNVVTCARQITGLVEMRNEFATFTSEAWDLSTSANKFSSIHEHLQIRLLTCKEHMNGRMLMEAFEDFKRTIETPQVDNLKSLQNIFGKEENLFNPDKTKVSINVLRKKHVLLLISDLDISQEEIRALEVVYKTRVSSGHNYEIIWLPIVDKTAWNDGCQKISSLQSIMSWYTVSHQFSIKPAVIKYIREVWGFVKKPIAVTLNPQGKVSQEKVVCFYGGVKMEWIESFTTATKGVAKALDIGLEMVYVGKQNARERTKKITGLIIEKQLSHAWQYDNVWCFWNLLENMLNPKVHQRKTNATDGIMQEVATMLGYDDSKNEWAVFFTGSGEMVSANGEKVLSCMKSFDQWGKLSKQMGFIPALRKRLEGIMEDHHCTRLLLPANGGSIPKRVQCAECGRAMEMYLLYRCCVE
ncbi:hypothetical protein Golax_020237 [Gossypium laxum]|uniref:Protein SIEVE ELEMENT OCCLUSION B-like n=1 Tax=Gossypium laxum TaxID=34288 RepID=A0A7J8Z935_9ROSI|nr:hypothetical protein [Gossypium laxum]